MNKEALEASAIKFAEEYLKRNIMSITYENIKAAKPELTDAETMLLHLLSNEALLSLWVTRKTKPPCKRKYFCEQCGENHYILSISQINKIVAIKKSCIAGLSRVVHLIDSHGKAIMKLGIILNTYGKIMAPIGSDNILSATKFLPPMHKVMECVNDAVKAILDSSM